MTIRVGVIGAGVMGADHARTISHLVSGGEVTAIADIDRPRAEELGIELGAQSFEDALELIASPSVDAVLVASHDSTHTEMVLAAIAAGKPVLCEKPLALDLGDCAAILHAEQASRHRLVSVGFSRRFDAATSELRDRVRAGHIGRPLLAHATHRNVHTYPGGDSSSTILSTTIHELDQIPWIFGSPVTEVSWHAPASTSLLPHRQDPQLLLLRTADGALTTVESFANAVYGYDIRLEVVGELGTLSLADSALVVHTSNLSKSIQYPVDWRPRFAAAYRAEVQAWVNQIASGDAGSAMATASDGYRATAVARAAIASMNADGATITVDYPDAGLLTSQFEGEHR